MLVAGVTVLVSGCGVLLGGVVLAHFVVLCGLMVLMGGRLVAGGSGEVVLGRGVLGLLGHGRNLPVMRLVAKAVIVTCSHARHDREPFQE
jgi:hypothetical protein